MSSTQSPPLTLFKSTDFWAINKQAKQHWDEVLPHSDKDGWEALHRLDHPTSGVLLFGLKEKAEMLRKALFQSNKIKKIYIVGASQKLPLIRCGLIRGFVGSRYRSSKKTSFQQNRSDFRGYHSVKEVSHIVKPLEHIPEGCPFLGYPYEVELITGARHQIRTYFAWAGAPICGDSTYSETTAPRLELHAYKLEFKNPLNPHETILLQANFSVPDT